MENGPCGKNCHAELVSAFQSALASQPNTHNVQHRTHNLQQKTFDAIVLGVVHQEFLNLDLAALEKENANVYDVKGIFGERCGWEVVNKTFLRNN